MRRLTTPLGQGVTIAGLLLGLLGPAASPARAVVQPAERSDFNGDGFADLAIGVPTENVGSKDNAGAINVLYGSTTGLGAADNQAWNQDSPRILGKAHGSVDPRDAGTAGDGFGSSLASADFNRDGRADLAIGNLRTEDRHVERAWELLRREAARLATETPRGSDA